ncbi:MAG: formate dehydrogenase subunit gamma [Pseudomonadales bacterium]
MTELASATDQTATLNGIIESHRHLEGPLLPILHSIQQVYGFIPDPAVILMAEQLQLSRAEVHGVISFYHFFRTTPPGKNTLQICRAESCQSMGSRALEQQIKQRLKVDYHQTTADGEITLEPVYCLGNCACSPSIRVNDQIHGRINMDRFEDVLDELLTVAVEVKL